MANEQPSRQTLDEIATRVLTFLLGVAKYPAIRVLLGSKGYNEEEHNTGWKLLGQLGFYQPSRVQIDKEVSDAVLELDGWDEPHFEAIRNMLARLHPEYVDVVFRDGLVPQVGKAAIKSVSTMLDRLDEVEQRGAQGEDKAKAAMTTLASRGYTADERVRLRGLVQKTKGFEGATLPSDEREKILLALYAWHRDWSAMARLVIKKRVHLIALGLAAKRKAEKAATKPADPPAAPAASPAGAQPSATPVVPAAPSNGASAPKG